MSKNSDSESLRSGKLREKDDAEFSLKGEWRLWLILHLVAWSVLPLLSNHSLHLDTIEALAWGKEWAWGYDKHPPLSAWAVEVFGFFPGDWGPYFLSQLCIVVAGLGIWKLGRDWGLSKNTCFLGVILLDSIYFYQYASPEYNVNYLQMPFWAWGWWFGFRGSQSGRLRYWIALGVAVGLGALTKYLAVFLVAPLLLAFWQQQKLLQELKRPGLYVAGVTSFLVFLPHLLWMRSNDWITVTYGLGRTEEELSFLLKRLLFPVEFLGTQFAILLPLILFTFFNRRKKDELVAAGEDQNAPVGLSALCLGGFLLVTLLALVFGWRAVFMWAAPMPLACGLWAATRISPARSRRAARSALAFGIFGLLAYLGVYGLSPFLREKPHRVNYPGTELALMVEEAWQRESEEPLSYVVAHEWEGGLVSWYGEDRAAVVIEGSWTKTPYLSPTDLREKGAMVVWLKNRDASATEGERLLADKLPEILENFPEMELREDLVIPWPRRSDGRAGRFGLAIIQPQEE